MKNLMAIILLSFHGFLGFAKTIDSTYYFYLDLTDIKNDQLEVVLTTPKMTKTEIIYRIPKVVPGTYQIHNFGQYITDFKAFDSKNKEMVVTRIDTNSWKILNAKKLNKISYKVNDTFDPGVKSEFLPGGTSIEDSVFVLNTHAILGYFENMKKGPYELKIKKPSNFYGSTSMECKDCNDIFDIYKESSYMEIADAPIMYNQPDTTWLRLGGAKILVSVYCPSKTKSSITIAQTLEEMIQAFVIFFNGSLPIKKYAFIIYLDRYKAQMMGALEHSRSSLYYLTDKRASLIGQMAAHEFYHIVTPLYLHSEEIDNFNFDTPVMSKHLWLYEGVTEYMSQYIFLSTGASPFNKFIGNMQGTMYSADKYNDTISFTTLSKNIIQYPKEYPNVYQKGVLISCCLDIRLRYYSNGKIGLQDLINELSTLYGKDRPFKDDELFDIITSITYPEIGDFLIKHVSGNQPLPYKETFEMIGVDYKNNYKYNEFSIGGFGPSIIYVDGKPSGAIMVDDTTTMNDFGKTMGYRMGDMLVEINGLPYSYDNRTKVFSEIREGDLLTVAVLRKNEKGEQEKFELSAKIFEVEKTSKFLLEPIPLPTEAQLKIRNAWTGIQ